MAEKLNLKMGRANLVEFAATLTELAQADRNVIAVTAIPAARASYCIRPTPPATARRGWHCRAEPGGITAGLAAAGKKAFAVSPPAFLQHGRWNRSRTMSATRMSRPGSSVSAPASAMAPSAAPSFLARLRCAARDSQPHHPRACGQSRDARSIRAATRTDKPIYFRFGRALTYSLHPPGTSSRWAKRFSSAAATTSLSSPPARQSCTPCWRRPARRVRAERSRVEHAYRQTAGRQSRARSRRQCRAVITAEEHSVHGGLAKRAPPC